MNTSNATFAGKVVTLTVALVTVMLFGTGCYLLIEGDKDGGNLALAAGGGALTGLVALLSRTRNDPSSETAAPVIVAPASSRLEQIAPPASPVPAVPEA